MASKVTIWLVERSRVRVTVSGDDSLWREVRQALIDHSDATATQDGNSVELPWWEFTSGIPALRAAVADFEDVSYDLDDKTKALVDRNRAEKASFDGAAGTKPLKESSVRAKLRELGFIRELTKHQCRNVARLAALPNGASFSVPGAGKTTEALATFCVKSGLRQRLVVVCPKGAFPAWEEQAAECLPGFAPTRLRGGRDAIARILSEDEPRFALITYQQVPQVADILAAFIGSAPTALFLDESHRIKSGDAGVWGREILGLAQSAEWRLILSGTPMPNAESDLLPQLRFLYPHISGEAEAPGQLIKPIYVRTTKAELGLKLPIIRRTPIPLTEGQQRLYDVSASALARQAASWLHTQDKQALRTMARSYMRLLQLVANPGLLLAHADKFESEALMEALQSDSPKIEYACYRARKLAAAGEKILIWTSFVENVEIIARRLADLGAVFIHGGTESGSEEEEETREHRLATFRNDENCFALVANPAACGEGISLHLHCHYALYVDRTYNACQFLQSQDRIHRLGLPKGVDTNIEVLCAPGTIDESVDRRLAQKVQRMREVLADASLSAEPAFTELDDLPDAEDVRDLLATLESRT